MKNLKIPALTISAAMLCAALSGCQTTAAVSENIFVGTNSSAEKTELTEEDKSPSYNAATACKITFSGDTAQIEGEGAALKDGELMLSEGGEYILQGKFSGIVTVEAGKNDEVKLILNNAEISTEDIAPIQILKAKKVYVILPENTENSLSNGESCEEDTADSALYSKADLTLSGEGSLKITAHNSHGIGGKDNLIITGGSYEIQSDKTGIVGKDSLLITGGSFAVNSGTNGIKSSNTELGSIEISGGEFTIVSAGDAVQSEGNLTVSGGSFDITAGGGAGEIQSTGNQGGFGGMQGDFGGFGGNKGDIGDLPDFSDLPEGVEPPQNGANEGGFPNSENGAEPPQGGFPDSENGAEPPQGGFPNKDFGDFENGERPTPPNGETGGFGGNPLQNENSAENSALSSINITAEQAASASDTDTTSDSKKGFKCGGLLTISGGEINISSYDDCLHSAGQITVSNGVLDLATSDDGIHSDSSVAISGGTLNISQSYEGIEGLTVDITGGVVDVTASDDGINGAGGSDTGDEDRWGRNEFAAQEGVYVSISGGEITVDAGGDGIDSNGDFYVAGGNTVVYGPIDSGNGALDYNGRATVSGGTFVAFGSSAMSLGFDSSSEQYSLLLNLSASVKAGEKVTITDSNGTVIYEDTPQKQWGSVVVTSEALKENMTVTVAAGDISETVTLTEKSVAVGNQGGFRR